MYEMSCDFNLLFLHAQPGIIAACLTPCQEQQPRDYGLFLSLSTPEEGAVEWSRSPAVYSEFLELLYLCVCLFRTLEQVAFHAHIATVVLLRAPAQFVSDLDREIPFPLLRRVHW
jgi:hypothetical protein